MYALVLIISMIMFVLLVLVINAMKASIGLIIFFIVLWFAVIFVLLTIAQKVSHKAIDAKNKRIKASGETKRKLSDKLKD